MWQYLFLMLWRRPGKSALASSGFLLAACALILLSATTQSTVVRANQIISQNWRPTYDLVVLPPQAKIPPNQNVPADLLVGYGGGISIQQYEQIKHIPGIDIAAPIAYVGYVQIPIPLVYFSSHLLPAGYYVLDWTLIAFDGQRQIVEAQQSYTIDVDYDCYNPSHPSILQVLTTLHIQYGFCPTPGDTFIAIPTPDNAGSFLLAAIDPAEENQLVHLDKSISAGRMLTEQDTIHLDERIANNQIYSRFLGQNIPVQAVPMLIHQNLPGQITLNARLTQLYTGPLTPDQIATNGGLAYLAQQPNKQIIFSGTVPLMQNGPQSFSSTRLVWDGHTWQILPRSKDSSDYSDYSDYYLDFADSYAPAGLTYQSATAPDGSKAYRLVPTGTQGPEVAFRELNTLHTLKATSPLAQEAIYDYEEVGQFTSNSLEAQLSNPLNWLPENTYTVPPEVLRYDAQGHPVTPTNLLPTTNPASYIMQPPLALTTLAAARELIGDHCINAIRIRVNGVVTPGPESWKHIQQVAQQIRQQTGLPVVVTLGSSPEPTLVYVPGVQSGQFGAEQTIDPVGWVQELWIQIAAGLTYLNQLGQTRLLLLGAILTVCLGYLAIAFSALVSAQRKEFTILNMLGWRPWQPIRLFLMQALILAIGGGLVGLGLALLIAALLEATFIWLVVIWTIPVMLAFALISVLYPLWKIWHIRPAEILRAGTSVHSGKTTFLGSRIAERLLPIGALALRNLGRLRVRALMSMLSLFLSALFLMLMFNGVLMLQQALRGTLLGNYVLLQTAVPQITGCVFAVILTFLSVADLLLLQVRERRQEIGLLQAIGWRPWAIQRLFVYEGLTLAIVGTVPGVLVSLEILSAQHSAQNIVPFPLIACGTVIFMLIISTLATLPALRTMNRLQVIDVLRAE